MKETERKDKTTRETDKKADGHLVLFVRRNAVYIAVFLIGAAFLLAAGSFDWDRINSYTMYNNDSRTFVRGRVVSVDNERLETDPYDHSRYLGEQELTVLILEGDQKGDKVSIDNYLSQTHNIYVNANQKIIVCADMPEGVVPYYTVFNYDRCLPLGILVVVFAAVMLFVGKGKGLRALAGVVFTLLLVVLFMVQAIYHGFPPVIVSILTILTGTAVSLLLLNGCSRRTAVSALATVLGVAVTGIIFYISSKTLHLTGFNSDNAEELLVIQGATGLSVRSLLIAGVLVSSLGAVMDVAVSLTAALMELVAVDPSVTARQVMKSGFNIGKDMIGTMSNTLILAFAGTALNTMLVLTAYGVSRTQFISSDYLAIELAQGLCATIGVILTVPITTGICAAMRISHR
jgi:uncharacterized membrane protein